MNEALFWAFSLYEKQDIKAKIKTLNNETIGMMSGLKYIINVMKHCNDVFLSSLLAIQLSKSVLR